MSDEKREPFADTEDVASACECTGLMPALPEDQPDAEAETARLYAIHAPVRDRKSKKRPR